MHPRGGGDLGERSAGETMRGTPGTGPADLVTAEVDSQVAVGQCV